MTKNNLIRIFDDGKKVIVNQGMNLHINDIHFIIQNYQLTDSNIFCLKQGFNSIENLEKNQIDFTISVGNDNSAFFQDTQSKHKCTLYPPPEAQKVEMVMHSITLQKYIVMLQNCSFCVYR